MNTVNTVKSKTFLSQKKAALAVVRNHFSASEATYNPEFVAKILESKKQIEDGQYRVINTDDLWK
jgi:hypothetical protein